VCVPGLDDPTALDALAAAEALMRAGSRREIAARYAAAPVTTRSRRG
jgi:hypothetical protein